MVAHILPSSVKGLMRQFLEQSVAEPGMSRAMLAAYKDELLKSPPLHKLAYSERN
ncbi:unnamed protein product [Plutella xylostella]|uniref:(diamondback moth) hypothetical protein n=1 Tax=Plutella xylostella TaxID=51655 RepID=A0A8S4G783_PLUXY|nr:unnamed protein product [Plutella xylostella]